MLTIEKIKATRIPCDQEMLYYEFMAISKAAGTTRDHTFWLITLAYQAGFLRGTGYANKKAPASAATPTEASPKSNPTTNQKRS